MKSAQAGTVRKAEPWVRPSTASRLFCARGFTLAEVVLAMAFLGLVVVSMSTILAESLRRHGANGEQWTAVLAAQRSLENELQQLTSSQDTFRRRLAQETWRSEERDGNVRIVIQGRRVDAHTVRLRVVARMSGRRVRLETLVGDRWGTN